MPRRKNSPSQAIRQAQSETKRIREHARKLLRRANTDLKGYRKQLAVLRKQGIVSKRINPKSHKPTRYMVSKLKKFKPVALGHEIALPAKSLSTHRLREYINKGLARLEGNFILRPKTATKQKLKVEKGHIVSTTSVEKGKYETVLLPAHLDDMHDVVKWLEDHKEQLMDVKGPRDQFGFQLSGHNSKRGFPNIRELVNYIMRYDGTDPNKRGNIFNGHSKSIKQEFVIYRFRPARGSGNKPDVSPYYGTKRYSKRKSENRREKEQSRLYKIERQRERKARQRMAESKSEYDARIARQREYDRSKANERKEKRIYDRYFKKG